MRSAALAVLVLWAGRNVILQGSAIYGPHAPPPPWAAAAGAASVDPFQGALAALAQRLDQRSEVVLVTEGLARPGAEYWTTYFMYPRRVRLAAVAEGDAAGLVIIGTSGPPSAPPGYLQVDARHQDDHWFGVYVRQPSSP
jgi:hypothetical protein